ncbi:hypothetical protein [Candidatus Endoriftia persephone]|uniref:Cytochrome c n=3 Tax=Gammaproteobacteria TaxID=1236 RepID=G2FDP8_9GAMM|nr:hypothetical protein [Candidatus Endoriftia persephone]EGV51363.1 hypothetical protein Rifp1Sym_bm00240 [endosymbiont of Riftia pachyptila (vent Ph05)]EGW55103.1 hypothetical protein TevJSym_af00680 [endosymbiont of Tevnia jerichonana (vent Tica)]USF88291.1 hypothetical protein L0Y14_03360 [Candidatus Endoriftia persephone]
MCKKCWSLVTILLLLIAAGAYKFLIQGSTVPASDGRVAIQLSTGERDLVLSEMRAFLASVQQITTGTANEEMARVAASARQVGLAAQQGVPGTLMGKLPLEFKKLGFDTHTRFDQLALDAEQLGDPGHSLTQLAELMQNCVACHAAYRFEVEQR